MQQVIYNSFPISKRIRLHSQIANLYEKKIQIQLKLKKISNISLLAWHFKQSKNYLKSMNYFIFCVRNIAMSFLQN